MFDNLAVSIIFCLVIYAVMDVTIAYIVKLLNKGRNHD